MRLFIGEFFSYYWFSKCHRVTPLILMSWKYDWKIGKICYVFELWSFINWVRIELTTNSFLPLIIPFLQVKLQKTEIWNFDAECGFYEHALISNEKMQGSRMLGILGYKLHQISMSYPLIIVEEIKEKTQFSVGIGFKFTWKTQSVG